jgi:hypothetical protein
MDIVEFLDKSIPEPNTGCYIWTRSVSVSGLPYGRCWRIGETLAHRVSWKLHFGDIPKDFKVLHKCDQPACVNPKHLFLGTQSDNMYDAFAKGRKTGFEVNPQSIKTHCKRGHLFDDSNTYRDPNRVGRICRACQRIYKKEKYDRQRERRLIYA